MFEQKSDIEKAVEEELEKVTLLNITLNKRLYRTLGCICVHKHILRTNQQSNHIQFRFRQCLHMVLKLSRLSLLIYIVPDDRVKKAMNEINAGMVHVLKLLAKGIM